MHVPAHGVTRSDLHATYRRLMEEHVVKPWFPHSIDAEYGGFHTDFDRRWNKAGPGDKLLEFQARQTLTAAELSVAFPENAALRKAVTAGFSFLREAMWDEAYGGWFARTDRAGQATAGLKHAHGMAYAIEACFAVYAATAHPAALQLGMMGFDWLEAHSRDGLHGGYFGPMQRDGRRLAAGSGIDAIGVPVGLKDLDVNKDMMGALAYASNVHPGSKPLRARAEELLSIMLGCFAAPLDKPWFLFHPDWTPASAYWKPSEGVHLAGIMIEARAFAPDAEEAVKTAARVMRLSFDSGWNARAGALMFDCGPGPQPTRRQQRDLPWWAQFELLKSAEYLAALLPEEEHVSRIRDSALASIGLFLDEKHGGFTKLPLSEARLRDRLFRRSRWRDAGSKADGWKDASHDGRTLLRLSLMKSDPPHAGMPV